MARQDRPLGRDFRLLVSAGTISNVGDGIDSTALPLLAAAMTTDPRLFAGVALASRLPWLLFALQAGALADRMDRRRLMISVNLVRTLLLGALGAAVLADVATIWLLYGVSFGLGISEVLFDTSAQALLPRVVQRDQLERANGLQMGAEIVANEFVGPPLGGLLFASAAALPILLDAGTFFVAAGLLALVSVKAGAIAVRPGTARAGDAAPGADPDAVVEVVPRGRVRDEVREGLEWLRTHRLLRSLAILLGLMNGTAMMSGGVLALFALEELGLTAVQFGFLLTPTAAAAVITSLVAASVVDRLGRGVTLWLTLTAAVVVPVAQGLAGNAWIFAGATALFGVTSVLWNVITVSLRQSIIPDHLLGRVNSVYRFLGWGSIPIGAFLGGELASAFGLRAPFFAAGAVMLVGIAALGRNITSVAIDEARATGAEEEPS